MNRKSLSYLGVAAGSPPDMFFRSRVPKATDLREYAVGDFWVSKVATVKRMYTLMGKDNGLADWQEIPIGNPGDITDVLAGDNITITGSAGPRPTVSLNKTIAQPATNASGTEGLYRIDGHDFMHAYGSQNTFLGRAAGSRALTVLSSVSNVGIGFSSLVSLTTGEENCSIGSMSLNLLKSGSDNVSAGQASLNSLISGSNNIALGAGSGYNYDGAESSNIMLGNEGVLGESNVMRLGTHGSGAGEQNATYIAGVYNTAIGAVNNVVFIDSDGKIGSSQGTRGQILIGSDSGEPQWAELASSDASIVITNTNNHIDLVAVGGGGGGGATTFITNNNSPAVIDGGNITFLGSGVLKTDGGTGSHIVTTSITNGTDGQILVGGGADAAWSTITSIGGTIAFVVGANTLNIEAVGGGGGGGTVNFVSDAGTAIAVGGVINILGGTNVGTVGAGSTITINADTSLALPETNTSGTQGVIRIGASSRFIHAYGTDNLFAGDGAGNLTLTVGSAMDNVGLGSNALSSLTTSGANTFVGSGAGLNVDSGGGSGLGYRAFNSLTSGSHNSGLGRQVFGAITSGEYNVGLGNMAGFSCTGSDSSNIIIGHAGVSGDNHTIRIGTQGTGLGEQDKTYLAGVNTAAPTGTNKVVMSNTDGKLSSSAGTNGQVLISGTGTSPVWNTISAGHNVSIQNNSGSITISSSAYDSVNAIGLITWQERTYGSNSRVNEISYGNGKWVIVTDTTSIKHHVGNPTNNYDWISVELTTSYNGCAYGAGVWVVVGNNGIARALEADLNTWAIVDAGNYEKIATDGNSISSTWVAVGHSSNIKVSTDSGLTWTTNASHTFTGNINDVHYANGYWVAVGAAGEVATAVDPSGAWTRVLSSILTTDIITTVHYGNGYWLIGSHNGYLSYSINPNVASGGAGGWTESAGLMYSTILSISHGDDMWVVCGYATKNIIAKDPTASWKQGLPTHSYSSATNLATITYGEGFFVCGGWDVTTNRANMATGSVFPTSVIQQSSGIITWQDRYMGAQPGYQCFDVAFGHGQFVMATNDKLLTCDSASYTADPSDPANWNQRTSTLVGIGARSGCGYGNGVWIVVGSGIERALEADLSSWTNISTAGGYTKVASDGNGEWVAVGFATIMVSVDDGLTWSVNASHPFAGNITDVHYANGYWVAVAIGIVAWAVLPNGVWESVANIHAGNSINRVDHDGTYWLTGGSYGKLGYAIDPSSAAGTPGGWIECSDSMHATIFAMAYTGDTWFVGGDSNISTITKDVTGMWKQGIRPFTTDIPTITCAAYGNGYVVAGSYGGYNATGTVV